MPKSAELLAGIATTALQAFEAAAPGVLANLPDDARQSLNTALDGAAGEAKAAVDAEVAAAENRLPSWLHPMSEDIGALLDKGLDFINEEAQAKAAPYLAAKQQLAAAGGADPGAGQ